MRLSKILFNLTCVVILISCQRKETRKVIQFFANGRPQFVNYYLDFTDTSTYRREVLFENGKKEYVGEIVNGQKEGEWTWWYSNGNKKDKCKYTNGKEIDTIFHWYENGKLKKLEILKPRNEHSTSNCTLCCNATFLCYYENGVLNEKFSKVNDEFEDSSKTWSSDGKLQEEGVFKNNKKEGRWKFFSSNGDITLRDFKNGLKNGYSLEILSDSTGTQIIKGQYLSDLETGLWKWYTKDSILKQTVNYENGKTIGELVIYYPNGKIKQKGLLINGYNIGPIKYFDENQKLIKTEFYKNNILQRTIKN